MIFTPAGSFVFINAGGPEYLVQDFNFVIF